MTKRGPPFRFAPVPNLGGRFPHALSQEVGVAVAHGDDDRAHGLGDAARCIAHNVTDLLDELIEESVQLVGKPVALMSKKDKVKAIGFLNDSGAFLVTKAGQKVCTYFGISKYTLYSYIDEAKSKAAR